MFNYNISVIVPCFNEERVIKKTINEVHTYLSNNFKNFEIIIVDDGSVDNTLKIIRKLSKNLNNIDFISYKNNKGKGYAVKLGIQNSKYKIALFMDADNATKIEMIKRCVPFFKTHDLIVASRNLSESNIVIKQPIHRTIMGTVFSYIVRFLFNINIKDTQCGFKVFCNNKSKKLFEQQTSNKWTFDVELIKNASCKNMNIKEVPVDWFNDNDSKLNGCKDSINMLKDVIKIWKIKR